MLRATSRTPIADAVRAAIAQGSDEYARHITGPTLAARRLITACSRNDARAELARRESARMAPMVRSKDGRRACIEHDARQPVTLTTYGRT